MLLALTIIFTAFTLPLHYSCISFQGLCCCPWSHLIQLWLRFVLFHITLHLSCICAFLRPYNYFASLCTNFAPLYMALYISIVSCLDIRSFNKLAPSLPVFNGGLLCVFALRAIASVSVLIFFLNINQIVSILSTLILQFLLSYCTTLKIVPWENYVWHITILSIA